MSSNDTIFPILFAKSLKSIDKKGIVSKSIALISWKGGDKEIEDIIKQQCDGIVVYGGKDTIMTYKKGLGLHTKLYS
jgi:hypothetical protein